MDSEEISAYHDTLDDFDKWLKELIDSPHLTDEIRLVLHAVRYQYHQIINPDETDKSEVQS